MQLDAEINQDLGPRISPNLEVLKLKSFTSVIHTLQHIMKIKHLPYKTLILDQENLVW